MSMVRFSGSLERRLGWLCGAVLVLLIGAGNQAKADGTLSNRVSLDKALGAVISANMLDGERGEGLHNQSVTDPSEPSRTAIILWDELSRRGTQSAGRDTGNSATRVNGLTVTVGAVSRRF